MLEKERLAYHLGMSQSFAKGVTDSLKKGDVKAALRRYGTFKKHAEQCQRLHKQLYGAEDSIIGKIYEELDLVCQFGSGKITENQLSFRMNQISEKYKSPSEKEEEKLRKQIRKEFLELGIQIQVIGQDPQEFVASRMIDTYRIARDRLDDGEKILRLIYVDNPSAPESIRKIIERRVKGEISKEDAAKQLTEREDAAKKYLGEMKIKATGSKESAAVVSPFAPYIVSIADKAPTVVFHKQLTSEDRLKADIIAESMDETGEVDKRKLFLNVAEIATYDEWAKLVDRLGGREPTPSELIDAMVRSYERTYGTGSVPDAFESEEGFRKWLKDFSSGLRENEKSLYEATLPAYRAVAKSLSKKK